MSNLIPNNYSLESDLFIIVAEYDEFFYNYDPYGISRGSDEYIRCIYSMVNDLAAGNIDCYIEPLEEIHGYCVDADDAETARDAAELIETMKEFKQDYESWKGESHES